MISPRFPRLLLALLAACFSAAGVRASVVQADLQALTRATSSLVALHKNGDLLRSTDNGASFTTTRPASGAALYNVVASGATVIAVGDAGSVVRSSDSGQNWSAATSPAFAGQLRDAAANGAFWVAVGISGTNVVALWSSDSGANWSYGTLPASPGTLRGVTYDASANRWTAVGGDASGAKIFTSTDGKNWSAVSVPQMSRPLTDVATDGQGRVLAVGEWGTLLVSSNGGQTFVADPDSELVSETLNVVVYSSASGFIAGGEDFVQVTYTAGGGATLAQAPVPSGGDIVALALDANGAPILGGNLAGYQTISFRGPGNQSLSTGSVTLSASATSGLAVSFELVSGPATLAGNVLTFTGTGTVVVRALQTGNASFLAAASVERSFEITAPTVGFEAWRAENFTAAELAVESVSGAHALASSDGFSNLLKYALGLTAKTPAPAGTTQIGASATHFTFTYKRAADRADVSCTVQVSTNLTTWTDTGLVLEQVSSDAQTETWRASYPFASAPNVFFRLKVSRVIPQ